VTEPGENRMKKAGGIFLIAMLFFLMAACAGDPGGNRPVSPLPGNLIMLDAGEWPENEYTADMPHPESGTVERGWIDPEKKYCYIEFSDMTQSKSEQYVEALKKAGFREADKVSEEIGSSSLSVGILLTREDTGVSLSYLNDLCAMYIKKK